MVGLKLSFYALFFIDVSLITKNLICMPDLCFKIEILKFELFLRHKVIKNLAQKSSFQKHGSKRCFYIKFTFILMQNIL